METRDFVESGLLESYVLGFATDEEKQYVLQKIETEPQLSDYVAEVETGIKRYFNNTAFSPPSEVREIIQLRSRKTGLKEKHNGVYGKASKQKEEFLDIEINDTYIKVHKYWRPAFIAVFVLSKVFLISGLYYYFKSTSQEQEILRLKTEIHQTK